MESVQHATDNRERLDKAAAAQLVFEDALFHIVQHAIRTTGAHRLVLAGGSALNCIGNMLLEENFHAEFYRRNFRVSDDRRLHVWVPPIPGDAGVAVGCAFNFAMLAGAPAGKQPLKVPSEGVLRWKCAFVIPPLISSHFFFSKYFASPVAIGGFHLKLHTRTHITHPACACISCSSAKRYVC